jgi:lipopolysaccharide biosynthesis glycosyltransferase
MIEHPKVFVGYDPREAVAYHVCSQSIIEHSSLPVSITPVYLPQIAAYVGGQKDGSNQFIYSRFLVPWLCGYSGWAIFVDGDMVVKDDIVKLWKLRDPWKAVQVVKHDYKTRHPTKYMGNKNEDYPRKNWSSVMLIHCGHFAWRQITPEFVTNATGDFLHRFKFIEDDRIGELPKEWNWLVEEYEHNDDAKLLHYSIGIPAFSEYVKCDHSADWWNAYRNATYVQGNTSIHPSPKQGNQ